MAYRSQEDLHCPICLEVFKDPVILPCSHSFCKACLRSWWVEKRIQQCPICKNTCEEKDVLRNLALGNLCETFLKPGDQANICKLHGETLKLFCVNHRELACVVCRDSDKHLNHKFKPLDEAVHQQKEELQERLKVLQERMKVFDQVKVKFFQTAEYIKVQAQQTQVQIKEQFQKLHRFLEEEEKIRMAAVMKEKEQKSQMMREKIDLLKREMVALLDRIKDTEKKLKASDVSVLLSPMDRVQQCPQLDDPQLLSGTLISQAKHLGNLSFNIWNKMKDVVSFSPVILDPNTANPELVLSDDLTSVRCGRRRQLPENPERINGFCSVLGSEGFCSGNHYWDVEVGNHTRWELGVLQESVQRKGDLWPGLWRIQLCDGKHKAMSPPRTSALLPVKTLQRITVNLDLNKKKLSFFNADTSEPIYTFIHSFTGRVFPYIWAGEERPLRILPVNISVCMLG
nr:zinc-binding protein A33 [Nothobranchius furzeri]